MAQPTQQTAKNNHTDGRQIIAPGNPLSYNGRLRHSGRLGFSSNHVYINISAFFQQVIHHGSFEYPFPPGNGCFANDDFGHVSRSGQVQERIRDFVTYQSVSLSAKLFGQAKMTGDALPAGGRLFAASFHGHSQPLPSEGRGHAFGRADELRARWAGTHAHEKSLGGGPGAFGRQLLPGRLHIHAQPVGGLAQGQLPQRGQVGLPEKVLQGSFGLLSDVNLARLEPLD